MMRIGKMPHRAGHEKSRRLLLYPITFKCLPLSLIDWYGKAILIGNRMLYSLNGTVGSAVHNWILRIRLTCLEPVTSAAMQCSCQPLTMCCHHRRKKGSQHIWWIPVTSARGSTIDFECYLLNNNFWETTSENKMDFHHWRIISILKVSLFKLSFR